MIVGGTRGAGRAFARRLALAGASVAVVGRRPAEDEWSSRPNVRFHPADLANPASVDALVSALASSPIAFSRLAFFQRFRGPGDAWEGELRVTLGATKQLIEGLKDHFAEGDRSIVLVGSVASAFIADEQPPGYHVAKAALRQMARYYACALGPRAIRVNYVAPATVVTEENAGFYRDQAALRELYTRVTPLRRLGTAEDVADAVDFLSSRRASFITGAELVVDGGLSLSAHTSLARAAGGLSDLPVTRR